jgi:malonyl-CoA/methylmalonyl-CoA synthetase
VHGIVNVVLCALWSGATCEAPGGFDAVATWERLASGELTLFMAVPTIYARLVAAWEAAPAEDRARWSAGAAGLRLMVCGSAALPVSTLEQWRGISGHVLLERYGMTELGMALSNTLEERVPGHVGWPLPGMQVRIVDDAGADVADGESGELLVRGPQVFREYWRRPKETAESFVDGWFRTGDVAVLDQAGYHRIVGRRSSDLIKSGGFRVGAGEVEAALLDHPAVAEAAVVGVPDEDLGQRIVAYVVAERSATPEELIQHVAGQLSVHKRPREVRLVDSLPRNAMGKVQKARLTE